MASLVGRRCEVHNLTPNAELVCGKLGMDPVSNEWSAQYPVIPGFQRNRALPCCSVTGEIPLTNARAAREVVERSRRLTGKDLGRLVRAQHKVSGYLGTKRSWKAAYAAAITAMDEAGRSAEVHLLEGEAFFAVIVAAVTEAANKGKDTRELMLEAQRFRLPTRAELTGAKALSLSLAVFETQSVSAPRVGSALLQLQRKKRHPSFGSLGYCSRRGKLYDREPAPTRDAVAQSRPSALRSIRSYVAAPVSKRRPGDANLSLTSSSHSLATPQRRVPIVRGQSSVRAFGHQKSAPLGVISNST